MDKQQLAYKGAGLEWERLHREYKKDQSHLECFCSSYRKLDPDFATALKNYKLSSRSILEVGCGYGEQSVALAREANLNVTSLEVSQTAIEIAQDYAAEQNININFVHDNVLTVTLENSFSAVFDRGCFTIIPHAMREQYAVNVYPLVDNGGYVFLKANRSIREKVVADNFKPFFELIELSETVYHSADSRELLAKFFVFKKINDSQNPKIA